MTDSRWSSYTNRLWSDSGLGVSLDVSRMDLPAEFLEEIRAPMERAFRSMQDLEGGAIANPDENRMVGHYWLRDPSLAPREELAREISGTGERVTAFARKVHEGAVRPSRRERFRHVLVVGIGGSSLGPQFVAHALGGPADPVRAHFFDNTDPDGMDLVLAEIGDDIEATLTVVISKSGGTKETRNGMLEAKAAYERRGLRFGDHAAAVTGEGSALEKTAREEGFLDVFPMWDWVGGRTSELSAVGLLPAALQGFDVGAMLEGARRMDACTRVQDLAGNPAALLAASWYRAGDGQGKKAMVVLPYKDRLLLFSRYLQQLVMESLGKKKDLDGKVVHQGLTVYGNKGSTDQHAYVQQLRDGTNDFFVTFLEVLRDREGDSPSLEDGATAGDFLLGFLLGTREALAEAGRLSLTVTLPDVTARSVGALIALYERAVGLYGSLIHVNAYHQPGVEAGKKAAGRVLEIQGKALAALREEPGRAWGVEELAAHLGLAEEAVTLFKVLEHAAANPDHGVVRSGGERPGEARFEAGK